MVLWVDKYRPTQLGKLDMHPLITKRLKTLCFTGGVRRHSAPSVLRTFWSGKANPCSGSATRIVWFWS
eukprot:430716-Amorphochlora_amoeboformis.AAC.3